MATVLITGCSSGFGKLAALEFAGKGDRVFATMRDTSKAGELASEANVEVLELDVTDDGSVRNAVREAIERAGRLDIVVNNAGIGAQGPIEETEDDEAKEIFETNFFGALRVIRAVLPKMREQRSGTIINVSSLAGVVCPPFDGIYSATKHALEALTEALHYEVHPFGVRVALVEPGGFETNIGNTRRVPRRYTEGSPYAELHQRFEQALTRLPTRGERADPQVVADAIYHAANDPQPRLRYLVGQDAEMIGGLRKQMDDAQFEQTMRQALDFWD